MPRLRPRPLLILATLSGLLLWGSFYLSWLTWGALVPLSLLVRLPAARPWIYASAYVGGLAWALPGVQWLHYCDDSAWLGWLLLAAYLATYFPAFVLLCRVMHRRWELPLLLVIPTAWVTLEYVRMHAFSGFGWLLLAHSLHAWHWTIQIADVGGVYAVSFLAALGNAAFVELLTQPLVVRGASGSRMNRWLAARLAGVFILNAAVVAYGGFRVGQTQTTEGPKVAVIQTDLEQRLKNDNSVEVLEEAWRVSQPLRNVSKDLVVWPETSYPFFFGAIAPGLTNDDLADLYHRRVGSEYEGAKLREILLANREDLAGFCDQLLAPVLIGTLRHAFSLGQLRVYNAAVLFAPSKGVVDLYDKLHLVPFGEYVPLKDRVPLLRLLLPYDVDTMGLDAATDYHAIHYEHLHFACLICFEDTLPHLGREFMRRATPDRPIEFFVSQCNDGWFQGSIEAEYHLVASVFRCIEARRPMVRSANMAVTALVDSTGRVVERLPYHAESHLLVTIPVDRREAPYVRLGDWLPSLCGLGVLAALGASVVRHGFRIGVQLRQGLLRPPT